MLVSEATLCPTVKRPGYSLGYTRKEIGEASKPTGRVLEGSLEDSQPARTCGYHASVQPP